MYHPDFPTLSKEIRGPRKERKLNESFFLVVPSAAKEKELYLLGVMHKYLKVTKTIT